MAASSPHKPSSKMAISSPSGSSELSQGVRNQDQLKTAMVYEIWDQVWEFPAPMFAKILSPKNPKPGVETAGELLLLDEYDCKIDEPAFLDSLGDIAQGLLQSQHFSTQTGSGESTHYKPLVAFLTDCVSLCHNALDGPSAPSRQDRWYKDLQFTAGKTLVDSIGGSPRPLKPDITGGHGISAVEGQRLWWDPPQGKHSYRLTIPVEVKSNWHDLISQAATYARGLFSADWARTFALVLAFDHKQKELRFLAFHRGGLTASNFCKLTEKSGLKDVVRIFLALMLWSTPSDAGFLTCFSDAECKLPADREGASYISATPVNGLSRSLCVHGGATTASCVLLSSGRGPGPAGDRNPFHGAQYRKVNYVQPKEVIRSEGGPVLSEMSGMVVVKASWLGSTHRGREAAMYRASNGRFGTIPHVCSYEAVGVHREIISNILFLPRDEDIAKYHWPILTHDLPNKPDVRTLWVTVLGVEGRSLVEAKSPLQLSRALVHIVLGWLSTYLSGYLQRNICIGNVLMTERPTRRKEFEIPEEFLAHLHSLKDGTSVTKIQALCERVKLLVTELDISDECIGFIIDGDLAIYWKDYFSGERSRGTKSDAPEFMSRRLSDVAGTKQDYLHSLIDDLESCFWVALWSVVFNEGHSEQLFSEDERRIRDNLARAAKDNAGACLVRLRPGHSNDIMKRFHPVLVAWWKVVRDEGARWDAEVLTMAPEGAGAEYYLPHFHISALQGVVDVLEVMLRYWNGEISWENWTASVPVTLH